MLSDKFFFFAISTFQAKTILCQTLMPYFNKILAVNFNFIYLLSKNYSLQIE